MKVFLGADHGGFEAKEQIKAWLSAQNVELEDCGAHELDTQDDYPQFAFAVAEKVAQMPEARGLLFCRSSGGVIIAANKVRGVRAVSVHDQPSATHAREHNNANVIGLAGDWLSVEEMKSIITTFLKTAFSDEERHTRRVQQIAAYEQK